MSNFDIGLGVFFLLTSFSIGIGFGSFVEIGLTDYRVNLKQDTEYQKEWVEVNGVDMPLDSLKTFMIRNYE